MSDEQRFYYSYPQTMLVVFGESAAFEAAKPLMEEVACFSDNPMFRQPPFSTASNYCRRALNNELGRTDYSSFLASVTDCILASLDRELSDDERYFGGALVELEQALVHPFRFGISTS